MTLRKPILYLLTALLGSPFSLYAQQRPTLKSVYFNLYTDSLKPVLNYYINVEGQTLRGDYLPLDSNDVILSANWGQIVGNEWVIPKVLLYDSVKFTAVSRRNPALRDEITIWIQKWKDPRDAPDYVDPESQAPDLPRRNRRN